MTNARPPVSELREHFGVPDTVWLGVNDVGWLRVLHHPDFADPGSCFTITARELHELSGREPRLMAKHDFRGARPWIFERYGLSILPLSRSRYLVGRFDVYADFPPDEELGPVHVMGLPKGLDPLHHDAVSSEGLALAAAYASGMLRDFLGSTELYPTVSGRMSTGSFDLRVGGIAAPVTVDRAQMEIDAGFESADHLAVVEAKNHLTADFNVRQLYYPYRRFSAQLSKPVRPVYVVYSNGVFRLYLYEFPHAESYRGIRLVKAARYAVSPSTIDRATLAQAVDSTTPVALEDIAAPFPQADSFDRVVNLCELLYASELSTDEIVDEYVFTSRQAAYYVQAAAFLGLAERTDSAAQLTETGRRIIGTRERTPRNLALVHQLASRPVLREALALAAGAGDVPPVDDVVGTMQSAGVDLGEQTLKRRARTVQRWVQWALDLCAEDAAGSTPSGQLLLPVVDEGA